MTKSNKTKQNLVKSKWDLVCIHWVDAFDGENGWTELEKYKPCECTVVSVGWLIPNFLKGYITIVSSYMPEEIKDPKTVGMPTHIPDGMIKKIYTIQQPDVLI